MPHQRPEVAPALACNTKSEPLARPAQLAASADKPTAPRSHTRRAMLARTLACAAAAAATPSSVLAATAAPLARHIGARRELLVDEWLVDRLTGDAALRLHRPEPREVVLENDAAWEGNTCAYYTIFRDDAFHDERAGGQPALRMYYRGSGLDPVTGNNVHPEYACYAESRDGRVWHKPHLGLFEHDGHKRNAIVWTGTGTHNFTVFRDTHPECPPEARYKALGRARDPDPHGLYAFQSADGLHWSRIGREAVIVEGAFDSQNLAFYDATAGVYRAYHRGSRDGRRDILTCTSPDFRTWTEPEFLDYPGAAPEQLYTNAIAPYARAPHLLLGFPTRLYPERGYQTEPIFMTSRDGRSFRRWSEPLIPTTAPRERDGNRSNYLAWGLVELPGEPGWLSMYATEGYVTGPHGRLRRFTIRTDGFVSAGATRGELLTHPLVFDGCRLELNYAVARGGSVRVEVQEAAGKPVAGLTLDDCPRLTGDAIDATVAWPRAPQELAALSGRPVRLRLVLERADVYALQFTM